MLKGLIVLLMIALLITLGAGLYFLMVDRGDVKKTRAAFSSARSSCQKPRLSRVGSSKAVANVVRQSSSTRNFI